MKYKITFEGWGAEVIVGSCSENMFRHFKDNNLDVSDYLFGNMQDKLSEEIHEGITEETKYDNDKFYHNSGPYLNDTVTMFVTDENEKDVYEAKIDNFATSDFTIDCDKEVDLIDFDADYILMGREDSKGFQAEYTLEIDDEFDPELLMLIYDCVDEDVDIITGVEYDGFPLKSSGGLCTTGKGGSWFILDNINNERTTN